jgi:phosphocarrier protein HPr
MIESPENSLTVCPPFMERELTVLNKLGLHARPAAEFVRCARNFKQTEIFIRKDGAEYSAASILELLSANLDCGAQMTLIADGHEAAKALDALSALMEQFRVQEEED